MSSLNVFNSMTSTPPIGLNIMDKPAFNTTEDRGDSMKILAMIILGIGSFVSGMIPAVLSDHNRRRFPLTTSLLLCFGAGVLLATALVHILPEVIEQLPSNYAEIALCGGFFIIYFIDEFVHFFFGEAIQHSHAHNGSRTSNVTFSNVNRVYGATETDPILQSNIVITNNQSVLSQSSSNRIHQHSHCHDERLAVEANARICHTSHTEPCVQAMTGTLGLFIALSLHSTIEGMTIGVQNSGKKVLFLLGAVACHKFVMGFCLGLELRSNPRTSLRTQFISIGVFAIGVIGGIGIGMMIIEVPNQWSTTAMPIIQALAGGTLFYVTVCEVIPREKARWHQNRNQKFAGFAQMIAILTGFTTICIMTFFLDGNHKS